jgi:hypothetical protein
MTSRPVLPVRNRYSPISPIQGRNRRSVGVLSVFLAGLASCGTLYCGIGRHTSPSDGTIVTSSLVVSFREHPQSPLGAQRSRPGQGCRWNGQCCSSNTPGICPACDCTASPRSPRTRQARFTNSKPWCPLPTAAKLAVVELSTPFEAHGPEFRAMVVALAPRYPSNRPHCLRIPAPRSDRYSADHDH